MSPFLRVALLLCVVFFSSQTFAQEDATRAASARALFEEGIGLGERGQWDAAADRFRRALSLRDSQVIRFNLAAALAELGRLVESSELLRSLLRADGVDASLRQQAEQRLAQMTPRIAKLTLSVSSAPDGAQVELDGKALPTAMLGVAIPADPGPHRARLLAGTEELDASELVLADGVSGTLTLTHNPAPTPAETAALALQSSAPEAPVLTVASHAPTRHDAPRTERKKKALWWGLGGGGLLVAGAVVAGVLLAPHAKKASPYRGDFEPGSVNVQVVP